MSFDPNRNPSPPPSVNDFAQRLMQRVPEAGPAIAITLKPAVRYVATATIDAALDIGASKYGGSPDLPADVEWPFWTDPSGDRRALQFHAQLDLREAHAAAPASLDLPQDGLLSFFVDFYDEGKGILGLEAWEQPGSRVLYSPAATTLQRTNSPVPELPVGRFSPVGCWTWRGPEDDITDDEFERLAEFDNEYESELRGSPVSDDTWGGRHQLGGHERCWQNPVAEDVVMALSDCRDESGSFDETKWARVAHEVLDWRLLFQLDTDNEIQAMWHDVGTIYWMARIQDIAAGQWHNGMFDIQST